MRPHNKGQDIIVPFDEKRKHTVEMIQVRTLWGHSEKILKQQRDDGSMADNCMNICVLKALKLTSTNQAIVDRYDVTQRNALHVASSPIGKILRTTKGSMGKDESILVGIDELTTMYLEKWKSSDRVFFTTGEKQDDVATAFKSKSIDAAFHFDQNIEYETNAAINFEICCNAMSFVGLSRSTFSNLITLKRHLIGKDKSYIYNYNGAILERVDCGLQPNAARATNRITRIN